MAATAAPTMLLASHEFGLSHAVVLLVAVLLLVAIVHKIVPKAASPETKKEVATKTTNKQLSPPGPRRLPLVGNLHQLGNLPHRSLQALSEKYGPLMLLHLGQVPTLVISSPELAQEVMKTQDLAFASRPSLAMANKLMYGGGDVAFAPYGEYWRQIRRICVLHLLSLKQVQSFRPVRDDEVRAMLRKISWGVVNGVDISDTNAAPAASVVVVNLTEIITTLTNNIICRAAFGKTYSDEEGGERIRGMLREFITLLGAFPVGDYIPWLSWVDTLTGLNARANNNFKQIDAFLDKVIDDRRSSSSSSPPRDFVDVLLSLDAADSDANASSLERKTIKALILDMFAGGTDTTATAIEWTMAELVRHPTVQARAQEEVRKVVGTKGIIEDKDLEEMHYLKAIIKESLRLHAPVPLLVLRESVKDAMLDGYHVAAKTRVIVNAWAIARDPKIWEFPEEFQPERFMHNDLDFKGQDFQYTPFGSGRRGCPGILFATPTIEHVLANLLLHFDWALPDGRKPLELLVDEEPGIAIHMKSNLVLMATARCT